MEGPDPDGAELGKSKRIGSGLGNWVKAVISDAVGYCYALEEVQSEAFAWCHGRLTPVHVNKYGPLPHLDIKETSILCADPPKAGSEDPAEIIRHVLIGYFSQKTGVLVHVEDSHLARIQSNGGDTVYWELQSVHSLMITHQLMGS
ncbi:Glutamyl-tRNA (Gln) amidotransferase subunit A (DUF620) [Melia azedarach]|uniref:Glutamyl-tRNA (Gln) amidotransferase subunit A (DUF620) n=1 Tax=Melia azedarach TaxID=155640 RepID=A0ACC1YIX6_MELAZ|nr:Glutamyl-tRNA (Gln) amidotransferase subunit A (DUF620) [Melia azedarach]